MAAQVEYLHVCDYAFPAEGGKPCIIGIFENISATSFPTTHPVMCVAVQLRDTPHRRIKFKIELGRPNGDVVAGIHGEVAAGAEGGAFVNANLIGVQFPEPGRYTVKVSSDDQVLAVQSLQLKRASVPVAAH